MNDLLADAVAAHGGLERWNSVKTVTVNVVSGGELYTMKRVQLDDGPRALTASLHDERVSVTPFGGPDWRMDFTPGRVAIETPARETVAELADPRASFAGHTEDTPWNPLQRAYFSGYAMWTYLTTPFLLTMPGFEVAEIDAWCVLHAKGL